MKLHRASGQGDWTHTLPHDRNRWQKLAAATNGYVTPGNLVTALGFLLVIAGLIELLDHHYWVGLLYVALGRLLDIADGMVADRTGTKSPIGETFDATVDKFTVLFTLIVFAVSGIISWLYLAILILPHLIISAAVVMARYQLHQRIHPSRFGKVSMALLWVSLVGFALTVSAARDARFVLNLPFYLTALWSFGLGMVAARSYVRQLRP